MKDGAVGVSTSLEYAPAPYAKTDELVALASEASKFSGTYGHAQCEARATPYLNQSTKPCAWRRKPTSLVEIWHLKVGQKHWGRMPEVVAKINAARSAGMDVSANTYAYTAWFNDFSAFIPLGARRRQPRRWSSV